MDKKELLKKVDELIKADLGQIPDEVSTDILPKEVAAKVLEDIREQNIVRQLFDTITVKGANLTIPRIVYGSGNVYKIGRGQQVDAGGRQETTFGTEAVVLEPQLLVAFTYVKEFDLETAGVDVAKYIRKQLAMALAEAELKAFVKGQYNASGTTPESLCDGIYTIAASATKCFHTPITYTDGDDLILKVSDAIKGLGIYGNDRGKLALLCSTTFENKLRKSDKNLNTLYGGLGISKEGLPTLFGATIYPTTALDDVESGEVAILVRKDAFIIGDRNIVRLRKKAVEEKFSILLIAATDVDFKPTMVETTGGTKKAKGLILIHKSTS
ncbi:MAG: phage major capsid protein [Candidatus Odinarchaeia archaeon]